MDTTCKFTVEAIAELLQSRFSIYEIAQMANCTPSAVKAKLFEEE